MTKKNGMIKTEDDIKRIREGGILLANIVENLIARVAPGVTTGELDEFAEQEMRKIGGKPAFKGYAPHGSIPFNSTICACINEEVVHAPAYPTRVLHDGDIFSIDIGMVYKERFSDMAITVPVGEIDEVSKRLINVTRQSLYDGLAVIKNGNSVRDIGKAVQKTVERAGFSIVRALVGHGVGYAVHEEPPVPNFDDLKMQRIKLETGMVIAVEPMVCIGSSDVYQKNDGWTIVSKDKQRSAHFEHTVVVTKNGYEILTTKDTLCDNCS